MSCKRPAFAGGQPPCHDTNSARAAESPAGQAWQAKPSQEPEQSTVRASLPWLHRPGCTLRSAWATQTKMRGIRRPGVRVRPSCWPCTCSWACRPRWRSAGQTRSSSLRRRSCQTRRGLDRCSPGRWRAPVAASGPKLTCATRAPSSAKRLQACARGGSPCCLTRR